MKKVLSILLALVLMIGAPVFAADQDIVEIASGSDDFSILVAALQKAELVGALQGEGPFTVFAPTDAAFTKLLGELNITAEQLLGHPQLKDVLLYHVVSGKVMSTDLSNGLESATLKGDKIIVDLTDGVKINSSNVVTADLEASNGVIHVIDTVLVPSDFKLVQETAMETPMEPAMETPMTVVDIALGNEDFSILVAALQKADLVGALQGEGPFTVFAPTNAAFEDLLKSLNISASDLLNQPDLSKVLLYHVVSGKVMSTDLSNGLEAPTLNGESVKFDLSAGVMVSGSNVTAADLEAGNGVIHVIDKVLVPSNFTLQTMEADTEMPKTGVIDLTPIIGISIMTLAAAFLLKKKIYG
ncbi:MAG: fasciclin domain-containing protein [Gudongella sp.]|nr:fasciclin domain-containing protein [Gudongella sp.]